MMDIINFSGHIRVGSRFPATIDLSPIGRHDSYGGVVAQAFTYERQAIEDESYVQIRHDKVNNRVGLFSFTHSDYEDNIVEAWQKADVIFDSRTRPAPAETDGE